MKKDNTIPAVEKTLRMLEFLFAHPDGGTSAELAESCGATPSTGYRIVQTLVKRGWVVRNGSGGFSPVRGKWGDQGNRLARLKEKSQWILEALSQESAMSCKLSVREDAEQVTIARAEGPGMFTVSGKIGARFPLVEGSVGAALLADSDEAEIRGLIASCGEGIAEGKDVALVLDRVNVLVKTGSAYNPGNSRWKIAALSVPVRDDSGVAAALTLLGPESDFTDSERRRLTVIMKRYAKLFFA